MTITQESVKTNEKIYKVKITSNYIYTLKSERLNVYLHRDLSNIKININYSGHNFTQCSFMTFIIIKIIIMKILNDDDDDDMLI